MGRVANNIDTIYMALCKDLTKATVVGNTRELLDVKFVLTDITKNIVSVRGISPSYLCGELLWYFSGMNSTEFISRFSKFWEKISDDGSTANSAYGYLMQKAFGFDQVETVIKLLKHDPNSRRAVINLNTPHPGVMITKDEPCTIALQFRIRKGNLDCTAMMRSNDIWFGTPYDVAFFTELQKYIAQRLGVGYGWYTHFATSLHMYDKDRDKVLDVLDRAESHPMSIDVKTLMSWKKTITCALEEHRHVNQKWLIIDLFKTFGILKMEDELISPMDNVESRR